MKKLSAILTALVIAFSAAGVLVGCGDNDPDPRFNQGNWKISEDMTYWVAGNLVHYPVNEDVDITANGEVSDGWDAVGSGLLAVSDRKFLQCVENPDLYKIDLDLELGESFKIRFESYEWDEEVGVSKLPADLCLPDSLKNGYIRPATASDANFKTKIAGKFQIRIDASTTPYSTVTYRLLQKSTKEIPFEYYLIGKGSIGDWDGFGDDEDIKGDIADNCWLVKSDDGRTASCTVDLETGDLFKFRNWGQVWRGDLNAYDFEEVLPNDDFDIITEGDQNGTIEVKTAGTYIFTITIATMKVGYVKELGF